MACRSQILLYERILSMGTPKSKTPAPPKRKKRIVVDASPDMAETIERMAESMSLSQVGTIRVAVDILAKLADELESGSEIVLRKDDKEQVVWMPHLKSSTHSD
jgi:hypothetical protein